MTEERDAGLLRPRPVPPGEALPVRHRVLLVLVLGGLTTLGPFTIDLYLPAFPAVERGLDVSVFAVQVTLAATTVGFAIGQLLVGPWSDRVGRRVPLAVATAVHIAASLAVASAPGVAVLVGCRFIEGAGAAAGSAIALAIVRDLFGGYPLVRMLSRLALVTGIAPILAPVIGSQLLLLVDWRGIFVLLAAYGALLLTAALVCVPETLPRLSQRPAGEGLSAGEGRPGGRPVEEHSSGGRSPGIGSRRVGIAGLLRDRTFVGVAVIAGMNFSAVFIYLASSSFLFQQVYGLTPQDYGLIFGINSVAVVVGIQTSARLIRRVPPQWILATAGIVQLAAAITICVLDLRGTGLLAVAVPLTAFIMAGGFCVPCVQVLALMNHGAEAGTAAATLGAVNFGMSAVVSPIVGLFPIVNALPMAGMMGSAVLVGMAVLWLVVRPWTVPRIPG